MTVSRTQVRVEGPSRARGPYLALRRRLQSEEAKVPGTWEAEGQKERRGDGKNFLFLTGRQTNRSINPSR
jgi:hypothetical protein